MLKQRIIATLVIKNNIVVQSIGFKRYLPVGKPEIAVEALNDWGVDEIVIVDIDASKNNRVIDSNLVKRLSTFSQVPLCVGGGINKLEQIKELLRSGADKVCINQEFLFSHKFITEASRVFGVQCIVVSLDILKVDNEYFVYDYVKKEIVDKLDVLLKKAQELGAGEILLNSVNNDGMKCGYDMELIREACFLTSIPIIAQGGAKNANDMKEAIGIKDLSAVAAANFFHFTEHSVTTTKSYMKKEENLPIRLETHIKYEESSFDEDIRLKKKDDEILSSLIFEIHEKEVI